VIWASFLTEQACDGCIEEKGQEVSLAGQFDSATAKLTHHSVHFTPRSSRKNPFLVLRGSE
jgi:hypothetical protein